MLYNWNNRICRFLFSRIYFKKRSKDKNFWILLEIKNKLKYINKIKSNRLKLTNLNLLDYKKLKKFLIKSKPELIYHFASDADVRKSFDLPYQVILNNNNITLNLLEAIRETNLKAIDYYM